MIILMKERRAITHTKESQNLFILKLAIPRKAMAVKRRSRPIHLVSQNKRIRIWHYRLVDASNVRIIRVAKLMDRIDLKNCINKKYDLLAKVLIDSDNFDVKAKEPNSDISQHLPPVIVSISSHSSTTPFISTSQAESLNIKKLYTPYVGSKSIQVVKQNISMMVKSSKLEKVYANL